MYTYVKLNVRGKYVEFPEKLDETLYNNLGTTYQDYLDNKWVLLTEEQVKFKKDNSRVSVKEVFDMERTRQPAKTLEQVKLEKKELITKYDSSKAVNCFYIQELEVWLDKATRAGLKLRFDAELAAGQEETILWYNNMQFPLTVETAIQMLYAIELYASACYDNTQKHLAAVEAFTTIEDVYSYDYTIGYPEKLYF